MVFFVPKIREDTNPSAILSWRFMGSVDSYIIIIMTLLYNSIITMI